MWLTRNRALPRRQITSSDICTLRSTRIRRLNSATRPGWNRKLAVDDLDARKRIVEHAAELAELAGIVHARKRGGEMDRMRIEIGRASCRERVSVSVVDGE